MVDNSRPKAPQFGEFFSERATAFSARDFELVTDSLKLPTSVHVMGQLLMLNRSQDAIDALQLYHANLVQLGCASTRTKVLKITWTRDDKVDVQTRTEHLDVAGDVITSIDVRYFMSLDPDNESGLAIELMEALNGDSKFSEGIEFI